MNRTKTNSQIRAKLLTVLGFVAIFFVSCNESSDVAVIPMPQHVSVGSTFTKSVSYEVKASSGLENEKLAVENALASIHVSDRTSSKLASKGTGRIFLDLDPALGKEAYEMKVTPHKVVIRGGSSKGVFYGIQTLLQEFNAYEGKAKCGTISDEPRYAWRGYMLDESRHFFGIEQVKQTLDMMAFYKLNKFHWHLTDAPGWRIEIKAYPELTTVGSIGCHTDPAAPSAFYTQDQIREVVAYAAARHIDVVPEIDMPGHASSATRSYPELGVGGAGSFTYNPGKEEVYTFVESVLNEVASLFPYEYMHIGGDEVFMGNKAWTSDPSIKALMEKENMEGIDEAEVYFLNRVAPMVASLGKKMIVWDDILDIGAGHVATTLSWWRHDRMDHVYDGIKQGYEMILCPRRPMYFDFVQDASHNSGRKWGKEQSFCPLEDVYAFPDALLNGWEDADASQDAIMGMQANLWSEVVKTSDRRDFMTYPRICALAEAAWTEPENKDYDSFTQRLEPSYRLFDSLGIYYYDHRDVNHHPEVVL